MKSELYDKISACHEQLSKLYASLADSESDQWAPPVLDPRFAFPPPPAMKDDGIELAPEERLCFDGPSYDNSAVDDDHDTLRPEAPVEDEQPVVLPPKEFCTPEFVAAFNAFKPTDEQISAAAEEIRERVARDMDDQPAIGSDAGGDTVCADVLQLLRRSGSKLTAGEVAKKLDSEDTKPISAALKRLIEAGMVSKEGEKRGTRYFAVEQEHQAAE